MDGVTGDYSSSAWTTPFDLAVGLFDTETFPMRPSELNFFGPCSGLDLLTNLVQHRATAGELLARCAAERQRLEDGQGLGQGVGFEDPDGAFNRPLGADVQGQGCEHLGHVRMQGGVPGSKDR